MSQNAINEKTVVRLVAAVQFINILDFMMVMPLGPDFASALGIPASNLGIIGGSYTAAAAVSGLVGSFFLDRFDRRKALAVAMAGLVLGTASGALATGLPSLVLARVVAGLFGGPATSLALSIVADVVPVQRRGHAMGIVMSSFSVASVFGVPAGLYLSRWGGWHMPFIAVAALGAVVTVCAVAMLPALTLHLQGGPRRQERAGYLDLFSSPLVLLSLLMTAVVMMGGFILIPNISGYVQMNLGYPRDDLGMLYLAGGLTSFAALRVVGGWVDRFGAFKSGTFGAAVLVAMVYCGFVMPRPPFPVMMVFVGFMLANSFRNVAYNTLASRIPAAQDRARYMSIQGAVQHLSSALAAFLSSQLLTEQDGQLQGMATVAWSSIALSATIPLLMWFIEAAVQRRDAVRDGVVRSLPMVQVEAP